MVYIKVIQKITPTDVSVSEIIDQKTYLRKLRGSSVPLTPSGSTYGMSMGIKIFPKILSEYLMSKFPFKSVIPKLDDYTYHYWHAKVFNVVRE